jgi:hypothetical protein
LKDPDYKNVANVMQDEAQRSVVVRRTRKTNWIRKNGLGLRSRLLGYLQSGPKKVADTKARAN